MTSATTADLAALAHRACRARRGLLAAIHHAGSGHPGGALSCTDLLVWLWENLYRDAPPNSHDGGEQFVLSKGHACPALYAVAAEYGLVERAELLRFRKLGSALQGHTHVVDLPWTGASTGSLGQGFSVAIGKSLALRHRKLAGRVTVILGDGELQEGEVWEGLMFAAHQRLGSLCAIVDYNKLQSDDWNANICGLEPLVTKLGAFGWNTLEIEGHDFDAIGDAVVHAREEPPDGRPTAIVAHTVKGKGVSYMEGSPLWHGSVKLSRADLERALLELGADADEVQAWLEGRVPA